jgi:hypothetical protein
LPPTGAGAAPLSKADLDGIWKGARGDGSEVQLSVRSGRAAFATASADGKRRFVRADIVDRGGILILEVGTQGSNVNGALQVRAYVISLNDDRQTLSLAGADEQGAPETIVLSRP